jgi:hypothetical protein
MKVYCTILFLFACGGLYAADSAFEPLWKYQGTWEFTMNTPDSTSVSNKIQNDCAERPWIIQGESKGRYYTQPILPDGHAAGRGELEIEGDRWTYPSKEEDNGKTKYYRITFSGKDRIHFERSESVDGKTWKVLASGDEVHTSQAGTRPDPRRN